MIKVKVLYHDGKYDKLQATTPDGAVHSVPLTPYRKGEPDEVSGNREILDAVVLLWATADYPDEFTIKVTEVRYPTNRAYIPGDPQLN